MSNAEVLGRFVWHELLTTDTAAAAAFYPKVLPWRTAPSSMPGYTIWMAGQTQIGGLMALPAEAGATPPHWLVYVGTPNVDATCSQAQGLGARIVKAPADIPNVGRFAVLTDPQGATFALFTPGAGPPPGAPPAQGGFSWHELATTDVAAALRFYGQLFGWTKGPGHDMGAMGVYQIFQHGGDQVGGIVNVQAPSTPPSWLSYVNVAEASRAVAAAKAGGGRLLHGPMEVPGGSWIAMMMDPQGGAFAVQEAPRAASQKPAAALKTAAAAKPPAAPKPATAPATPAAVKPAPAKPAAATPAAAKPATPAATVAKVAVAAKVAKVVVAAKVAKTARKAAKKAKKAARKVRRAGRKVARKVRRAGRKTARKAARPGVRRAARKAARKTARRVRRSARGAARGVRRAARRVRRAARRRR
ncbi:MAG TPA: VOC family protein [Steroidobacteraceae bacterium]|nr:VOC family protein [Steroidobacteraceae bacterium]